MNLDSCKGTDSYFVPRQQKTGSRSEAIEKSPLSDILVTGPAEYTLQTDHRHHCDAVS